MDKPRACYRMIIFLLRGTKAWALKISTAPQVIFKAKEIYLLSQFRRTAGMKSVEMA